jgi:Zn-dependent protease with chaperone function
MMSRLVLLAAGALLSAPRPALAQEDTEQTFKFTKVDLALLDEVKEVDRQLEKKGVLFTDPELTAYLQNVAERMLGDKPAPENVTYRVRVLRDPLVNAFALPNGSVYVNTGLLAVLENESQLAAVLGHEVTHAAARHSYQYNRSLRKKSVAMHILAAAGSAGGYFPSGSVFGSTLTLASNVSSLVLVASVFGYSQNQERDADRLGLDLMMRGKYDPAAMPATFGRMDEKLEVEPVETFYRTHPKLVERIATTKQLAANQRLEDARPASEADYLTHVAPAICYNIQADLASRRARTAIARADRLVRWRPDEPLYRSLLADGYRVLGAKTTEPGPEELERRGQSEHRKRLTRMTEAEEQHDLLQLPDGPDRKMNNQAKAEELYLSTIEKNPESAEAHRGLAMLYEDQERFEDAVHEFGKYLELAPPDAPDRLRIERRLEKASQDLRGRRPVN